MSERINVTKSKTIKAKDKRHKLLSNLREFFNLSKSKCIFKKEAFLNLKNINEKIKFNKENNKILFLVIAWNNDKTSISKTMNAKNDTKITKIFFAIDAIRYEENKLRIIAVRNI